MNIIISSLSLSLVQSAQHFVHLVYATTSSIARRQPAHQQLRLRQSHSHIPSASLSVRTHQRLCIPPAQHRTIMRPPGGQRVPDGTRRIIGKHWKAMTRAGRSHSVTIKSRSACHRWSSGMGKRIMFAFCLVAFFSSLATAATPDPDPDLIASGTPSPYHEPVCLHVCLYS
jgi:hypothetical protein